MRTPEEVDAMHIAAQAEQVSAYDTRAQVSLDALYAQLGRNAAYAEGVEAALLWVLGDAGSPFPR